MYKGVSVTSRSLHWLCQVRTPLVQQVHILESPHWRPGKRSKHRKGLHVNTWARSEGMPCNEGNPEPSLITKGPGFIYLQISHDIFLVSQQPHSTLLA